jgi:hypothetical protein
MARSARGRLAMRKKDKRASRCVQAAPASKIAPRRATPPALFDSDLLPARGFALEDYRDADGQIQLRLVREGGDLWDETTWQRIEAVFGVTQPDPELREAVRQAVFHYLAFVPRDPLSLRLVRLDLATIERAARRLHAVMRRVPATRPDRERDARERTRAMLVRAVGEIAQRLASHHSRTAADLMPPRGRPGTASASAQRLRAEDDSIKKMIERNPDLAIAAAHYNILGGNAFLGDADFVLSVLPEYVAAARRALPSAQPRGPKLRHPSLDRLAWKLRALLRARRGPRAGAITWNPYAERYTGDLYELVALIARTLPPGSIPESAPALGKALRRALERGARTQFA